MVLHLQRSRNKSHLNRDKTKRIRRRGYEHPANARWSRIEPKHIIQPGQRSSCEKGTAESGASSARMQITRNRCWQAEKDIVPDNRVKKENVNGATRSNRMFRVSMLGYLSSWTCAQCLIERLPNILS
jgi:hypothetical protein